MRAANDPGDVKTERDLTLPQELAEGYQATFERLCRMFRARGVPPSETADLAQETIARTLLHLRRRGMLGGQPSGAINDNGSGHNGSGHNGSGHNGSGHNGSPVSDAGSGGDDLRVGYDAGIEPLIKRIAINLLIDRARAASPLLMPIDSADDVVQPGLDPSDEVARRQQREQVHQAIDGLASRHRTAMLLSLEGLTPAEIAGHLGIQRNAADALLYRARRSLAKHLGAITGLIRGLAVLVALRVRALARRSELARLSDASLAGQTALGITAATIGTVMALALPAVPSAADPNMPPVPSSASTISATDIAPALQPSRPSTKTISPSSGRTAAIRPTTDVDIREHSVRTGAHFDNPSTGEEEQIGLDLIHDRDQDERGVAGPLLDTATETACTGSTTCEE